MTAYIAALGALSLIFASPHAAQQPDPIAQLVWMSGCWTQTHPDGLTEEHWMKPAGGSMLGMSRSVRGGRTTEFEFLQIADVKGSFAYIARPSGQAETTFPVKTLTEREVVFENPTHDFPQRVIYRRNADGSVTARIEGTMNGQLRGVEFPYTRCK
jgi:hypothetical protein